MEVHRPQKTWVAVKTRADALASFATGAAGHGEWKGTGAYEMREADVEQHPMSGDFLAGELNRVVCLPYFFSFLARG